MTDSCGGRYALHPRNSTDDTAAVIRKHEGRLPLRCVREEKQGLSHARNRVIEEARGEVILWTDDDVLVDENWLAEYAGAVAKYPDVVFFGGPVKPWFEEGVPDWLKRDFSDFANAFACVDYGPTERQLSGREYPFGANMAVRKSAYREVRYNPDLGRIGNGMLSGEETEVFDAIRRSHGVGMWLSRAKVRHFIPRQRATRAYLRKYYRGLGCTRVRMGFVQGDQRRVWFRVPRWMYRRWVELFFKSWMYRACRDRRAEVLWTQLHSLEGEMLEHRATRG